jgi:oligopeptide/dipeptide ABC transporter ATP-binding protein
MEARSTSTDILSVHDLVMEIEVEHRKVSVVDGVSFALPSGSCMGLVGESGSGKSLTCMSVLQLLPSNARIASGRVLFGGEDVLEMTPGQLRALRGRRIALIPQDPQAALNPVLTVERQVSAPLTVHGFKGSVRNRVLELLRLVRLPDPSSMLGRYPHQLSGGMRQRVVWAMALAAGPELLVADEPMTALDPTLQLQFVDLLGDLKQELGLSVIFVTHDFGLVRMLCDQVAVMYAGRIVEYGRIEQVIHQPMHPYTKALLAAVPALAGSKQRLATIPGSPPLLGAGGPGCRFVERCPSAMDRCHSEYPPLRQHSARMVACWLHKGES